MDSIPQHFMDMPAAYRIRVHGRLSRSWIEAAWGGVVQVDDCAEARDQTVFIGAMTDQAALVGCINTLYNLGHAIISVEIIQPRTTDSLDEGEPA